MSTILGVANPKGGVAKTTTAFTVAAIASEQIRNVLLVDADYNRSSSDWAEMAGDDIAFSYATEDNPSTLSRLRHIQGFTLIVVDLPGARATGELAALLRPGRDKTKPVDMLLMPVEPTALDLRVLVRAIREEVTPADVAYRVMLTKIHPYPASLTRAGHARDQLRTEQGIEVLDSLVRDLVAHKDATAEGRPITRYGGRHSMARAAEADYRAVARELFPLMGVAWKDGTS